MQKEIKNKYLHQRLDQKNRRVTMISPYLDSFSKNNLV